MAQWLGVFRKQKGPMGRPRAGGLRFGAGSSASPGSESPLPLRDARKRWMDGCRGILIGGAIGLVMYAIATLLIIALVGGWP